MFKVWDTSKNINVEVETIDEAHKVIDDYLKKINFKSYYTRTNFLKDNTMWIDYGSHTHFFYIKEVTNEK
jgi:hypothetical protein